MAQNNLYHHALTELTRAGWFDEDSRQEGDAMLRAVEAFSDGGWSGGSAPFGARIVHDLLMFKPLGPLTDDPAEWIQHEPNLWQSRRKGSCFSSDGGKTYRDQDDARVSYPLREWPRVMGHRLFPSRIEPSYQGYIRGKSYGNTKLHRSEPHSSSQRGIPTP